MAERTEAVCLLDTASALGEGPQWDAEAGRLWWVDILGGLVHRLDPATGEHREWRQPERVAALALRERGGLLLALASGFAFFDPETDALERIDGRGPGGPDLRYNDSKCDRRGRFWAGSMHEGKDKRRTGGLSRLDPDLSLHAMETGIGTSNSIAWSPDDRTFYYSDTAARVIWAYDFDLDAGTIANRRVLTDMDGQPGGPDGSTVDAEGFLWNAQWGGWRLVRYAPDGRVDRVVPMPVAQPTSCMFGGEDLATLYVTSARTGLSEADLARQPQAGGLFALDVGVRGLPEPRFAG
jgi:sugar lactone lactonase YvrE